MLTERAHGRLRVLPRRGHLLVSTDLHGNLEDFTALEKAFEALLAGDSESHWALLGDAVHGPDERARRDRPDLYGFIDNSRELVAKLLELPRRHPGRVHYVLGNHDFGHVGGPHTSKFHPDEVQHLEAQLTGGERESLRAFFAGAAIALAAPCGALLTHGSPDDSLARADELAGVPLPPEEPRQRALLNTFLTSYGQPAETTSRLLATLSRDLGFPLRFVVHGHDRDEAGIFIEGGNQLCPVLFGAPREQKRYLVLDLAQSYASPAALREGAEILPLHPVG